MYVIINRTTEEVSIIKGDFPEIVPKLEKNNDIIIISTYSDTLKVPYINTEEINYDETKSGYNWAFKEIKISKVRFVVSEIEIAAGKEKDDDYFIHLISVLMDRLDIKDDITRGRYLFNCRTRQDLLGLIRYLENEIINRKTDQGTSS